MKTIYLIGLGPGDPWAVTVRSHAVLKTVNMFMCGQHAIPA